MERVNAQRKLSKQVATNIHLNEAVIVRNVGHEEELPVDVFNLEFALGCDGEVFFERDEVAGGGNRLARGDGVFSSSMSVVMARPLGAG